MTFFLILEPIGFEGGQKTPILPPESVESPQDRCQCHLTIGEFVFDPDTSVQIMLQSVCPAMTENGLTNESYSRKSN